MDETIALLTRMLRADGLDPVRIYWPAIRAALTSLENDRREQSKARFAKDKALAEFGRREGEWT